MPAITRSVGHGSHSVASIGARALVLDIHDGELLPSLENRRTIISLIRDFGPDLIMSPRPNDYHPDHRYTSQLIQDAAYMVTVPNICAFSPHLPTNPVIVYVSDHFQKPYPFTPHVIVPIDRTIELKFDMLHCHTSQMYEWLPYNAGNLADVPHDEAARRAWLRERLDSRMRRDATLYKDLLVQSYGAATAAGVQYAEAFEGCEYGTPLSNDLIPHLFPFFD